MVPRRYRLRCYRRDLPVPSQRVLRVRAEVAGTAAFPADPRRSSAPGPVGLPLLPARVQGRDTRTRSSRSARPPWTTRCSGPPSSSNLANSGSKGPSQPTSPGDQRLTPCGSTKRRLRPSRRRGCTARSPPPSSSSPTVASRRARPPCPKSAWPWPSPTWTSATSTSASRP